MDLISSWPQIRRLCRQSFFSSLHFAFATVNADGTPHVTPIGSLLLRRDAPAAIYFEVFTSQLPRNLEQQQRICVLAVNSSPWFWLWSLLRGRFATPPAIRLLGTAGPRRRATEAELALWRRRTAVLRPLKGYQLLWGKLQFVRDIQFDAVEPVALGQMTRGLTFSAHE